MSHQCENGATCEDKIGSYECKCSPGYAGIHCQFKDRCFVNPCQSGAVCNTLPIDGTYSCSCKPGFTGVNCTEDLSKLTNLILGYLEKKTFLFFLKFTLF